MATDTVAKIRIDCERKARWQAGAACSGRTLSEFIRHACDDAVRGLDSYAIRGDLIALRRYVNSIAQEVANGGFDPETAFRLRNDTVAMRAVLDGYLVNR